MTKNGEKLLYEKESYIIRGATIKIWQQFGSAFKENIIENALNEELQTQKLNIEKQKRINVYYNNKKIGVYIPDLIINDKILLELKRKPFLTKQDKQQFWYYLKATKYKLGFLINFGDRGLQIKRRIYDKARNNQSA